jgi:hypothetical protein
VTEENKVWIKNEDSAPVTVEYAFQDYTFPVGRVMCVPRGLADMVFGYSSEDKGQVLISLGWIKYNSDVPAGLERLAKIKISDSPPEETRLVASVGGVVPLYVQKAAGRKASAA